MDKQKKTLHPDEIVSEPIGRRSALGRIGVGVGSVLAAVGVAAHAGSASAQVTDSDPSDPACHGRGPSGGVTDSDPSDPAGQGRGLEGGAAGISDCDPSDPAGQGRGTSGTGRGRTTGGVTDSDPSDPVGHGRGATLVQRQRPDRSRRRWPALLRTRSRRRRARRAMR